MVLTKPQTRLNIFSQDPIQNLDLDNPYFNSHLITYIGNKRRLLPFLYSNFLKIRKDIGKDRLTALDGFAGSGASARLLKAFANELHVNDLEDYSETINRAYLTNRSEVNLQELNKHIQWLNDNKLKGKSHGFIRKNYSPKNDKNVKEGERVFYTNKNAQIIDNVRKLIDELPGEFRQLCLASLLVKSSIHTNTSGVFKGFHKKNGIGHFGGHGENALSRITREIVLDAPVFSDFESKVHVHKRDTNKLVQDESLPTFDLVYYDPPYNQHPYGSNYFMLNIINSGVAADIQDGVSGISTHWNKSAYNKRKVAEDAMDQLLRDTRAKYIAISYNDEGIIPINTFKTILSKYGTYELQQQNYNTYRGSRNLQNRSAHVTELLWILKKR